MQGLRMRIHLHYYCPFHQSSVRQQAMYFCSPPRLAALRYSSTFFPSQPLLRSYLNFFITNQRMIDRNIQKSGKSFI